MKKLPVPTENLKKAVKTYLMAKAYVDTVRPVVEAYQQKHIDIMRPVIDGGNEVITTIRNSFRMSDSDFEIYSKSLHEEAIAAGFKVEKDICPLLVAENQLRIARHELIDAAVYITTVTFDQLMCAGIDKMYAMADNITGYVVTYLQNRKMAL